MLFGHQNIVPGVQFSVVDFFLSFNALNNESALYGFAIL